MSSIKCDISLSIPIATKSLPVSSSSAQVRMLQGDSLQSALEPCSSLRIGFNGFPLAQKKFKLLKFLISSSFSCGLTMHPLHHALSDYLPVTENLIIFFFSGPFFISLNPQVFIRMLKCLYINSSDIRHASKHISIIKSRAVNFRFWEDRMNIFFPISPAKCK